MTADLTVSADGVARCGWAGPAAEYLAYHDDEWGRPIHGDVALFERFTLEAFQSGLSWLTILRKRTAFRAAFAGFDPAIVATFTDADRARLMGDAGIVRNRAKIEAAITNAAALVRMQHEHGPEALDALVWGFAESPGARARPGTLSDVPSRTPASAALASALKKRGFVFVGPTTAYAAMQACGLVDDHVQGCRAATDR